MGQGSFPHIFTVGISKITFSEGEILITRRQWNRGFNPFSFSLTLSEQSEEKLEESQEAARDTAIVVTIHT